MRENRPSGLMRSEVKARDRQLRSVQPASFHFAYSTLSGLVFGCFVALIYPIKLLRGFGVKPSA
jgi:hypothetical protein